MLCLVVTLLVTTIACVSSQQVNVVYSAIQTAITNPERGFYYHTEVHSSQTYRPLVAADLQRIRSANNTSIVLRVCYMPTFINSAITAAFLNGIQTDFDTVRATGFKIIIRFAYSDNTNGVYDTTKARILSHIEQLKPYLTNNIDVILAVEAGFIGVWGEWYYTNHFGMYPNAVDYVSRAEVTNALLDALPSSRMVLLRTPTFKKKMYSRTTPLTQQEAFSASRLARLGQHNDCFLASEDDFGTYTYPLAEDYAYLKNETLYVMMGGETCFVNPPRSQCPTALAEIKQFHWTYLNSLYHPDVLKGFQTGGCYDTIKNKLGYRFELVSGSYPNTTSTVAPFQIDITLTNTGYAPVYNERKVYLVLRNAITRVEYAIELKTDPRFWQPDVQLKISESLSLPGAIAPGSYNLFLNLPDSAASLSKRPEYSIQLANSNTWEASTGYNSLQHNVVIFRLVNNL
jgi:hypothetical protein